MENYNASKIVDLLNGWTPVDDELFPMEEYEAWLQAGGLPGDIVHEIGAAATVAVVMDMYPELTNDMSTWPEEISLGITNEWYLKCAFDDKKPEVSLPQYDDEPQTGCTDLCLEIAREILKRSKN